MGVRHKGRELAVQVLYLMDVASLPMDKAHHSVMASDNVDPESKKFATRLIKGVTPLLFALDALIQKHTTNWDVTRMAAIDRNIIRLGTYELMNELDTPISVIINEAVDLAKAFSTDDSGKFVNGILDKLKLVRDAHKKAPQNA